MFKIKYIAHFFLYTAMALAMLFVLGPLTIRKSKEDGLLGLKQKNGVEQIKLYTHPANNNDLRIVLDTIQLQFDLTKEHHQPFAELLFKNGLIAHNDLIKHNYPLHFKGEKLAFVQQLEIVQGMDKRNHKPIKYVKINDTVVFGRKPSDTKYGLLVLGYVIIVIGLLGILFIGIGLFQYIKYGDRPIIPNRWKGIENLFGISKKG